MVEKKSILSNMPAVMAAAGGLITAIVGLLAFMSTPAPSIAAFDASPNIIAPGESSILKWSVAGDGVTVAIEPDIGAVALSGTREVAPDVTTNYTLTARIKEQEKAATLLLVVREKAKSDLETPAVAKSDVPGREDQEVQSVREEKEVSRSEMEASEEINPVESTVAPQFDSQQKAQAEEPSLPAAEITSLENDISQAAFQASEDINPVKSTVTTQSDSQQNAAAETALSAAASLSAPTEFTSSEAREADVESDPVIEPETVIEAEATPVPAAPVELPPAEFHPAESIPIDRAAVAFGTAGRIAANGSDTAADEGITPAKAVRVITSADWNPSNTASSRDDFSRSAPIYAKLQDSRHRSAQSSDIQDAAFSDPSLYGSDYMSADISSQGPLSEDMQSPDALELDPLGPDAVWPDASGQEASIPPPA